MRYVPAHPLAILQAVNGAIWAALGALNLIALAALGGTPALGWGAALVIGAGAAIAVALLSARAITASLGRPEAAAGRLFAAPSQTVGRCLGPAALAVAILLVLGLAPGGEPYRGLAAALFLCFGLAYLALALWVRRLEERRGVIITQPVNRYGVRTGDVLALRLPR